MLFRSQNIKLETEIHLQSDTTLSEDVINEIEHTFNVKKGNSNNAKDNISVVNAEQSIFIALFTPSDVCSGQIKQLDELTVFQSDQVSLTNQQEYFNAVITSINNSSIGLTLAPFFMVITCDETDYYLVVYVNVDSWNFRMVDIAPNNANANGQKGQPDVNTLSQFIASDSIIGNKDLTVIYTVNAEMVLPRFEFSIYSKILLTLNRNIGATMRLSVEMNFIRFVNLRDVSSQGKDWHAICTSEKSTNKDSNSNNNNKNDNHISMEQNDSNKGEDAERNAKSPGKNKNMKQRDFKHAKEAVNTINDSKIAYVIPIGHGKTTLANKYKDKYVDVDTLYDTKDVELNNLRKVALKTGSWNEYNKKYFGLLRKAVEDGKIDGKIVLLHDVEAAKAMGLNVKKTFALRNKEKLIKHLTKEGLLSEKDVALSNLANVSKTSDVTFVDDIREIENLL